jgi:geranylgeranyl diphosphate/geranylgeranyl-bacteriochlorophyllide a reductase
MDNAKPCGGAIPVCMVEEFNLPSSIIDRKVAYHEEYLAILI